MIFIETSLENVGRENRAKEIGRSKANGKGFRSQGILEPEIASRAEDQSGDAAGHPVAGQRAHAQCADYRALPLPIAEISRMSSSDNSKSKMPMFSWSRSSFEVRGIADTFCCSNQRRQTWAAVLR